MVRLRFRLALEIAVLGFFINFALTQYYQAHSLHVYAQQISTGHAFGRKQGMPDPNQVFQYMNRARMTSGLPPLEKNDILANLAEQRAKDMAANTYYAHKDSKGQYFDQLLRENGYTVSYGCENLDLEFTTMPEIYVNNWLSSTSGHRECLLNSSVTEAGYAVASIAPMGGENIDSYVVVAIHSTKPEIK